MPRQMNAGVLSAKDKEWARDLWARIVEFDLNLGKNPALTIAKRFSRESTNDLGDTLNLAVGTMVIIELKKFFFLSIVHLKQASQLDQTVQRLILTCPFQAPPMIAKAWDLLTLYTEHYEAFCKQIMLPQANSEGFAWLYKKTIPTSVEESFASHSKMMALLEDYRYILYPWWALWPRC